MLKSVISIVQYTLLVIGTVFITLELLWFIVRSYAMNSTTAMGEVSRLRHPRPSKRIAGRAVIAGGSLAGLATAIVCSRFFDQVTVVEPDSMGEAKRTRVAQAEQVHGIHAISLKILRGIIPEFDRRILKFGGRILESNGQAQLGTTKLRFTPGALPKTVYISRIDLEHLLREYILEIMNISVTQAMVIGVVPNDTGSRIAKVIVQPKHNDVATTELQVAMLADCSGPAAICSRLLEKAQGAHWGPYPKISYDPKISYATAVIPVPSRLRSILPIFNCGLDDYSTFENLGYIKSIITDPEQDNRLATMVKPDNDHIMCGMGGWDLSPDMRPLSFSDYIEKVDSIWQNAVNGAPSGEDASRAAVIDSLQMIKSALKEDKIDPQFKYCKMGVCYKIDYSKAPKPSNFVTIGDSVLRVNPTFGQGISKAMVDVATLNGALLDTKISSNEGYVLPDTFSSEMIARQYPRVMHMWDSTKDSDYGRSTTELAVGESPDLGAFGRSYWRGVVSVASRDKAVALSVNNCIQLIAPNIDLLRPSLFIRAMWSIWRARLEVQK